MKMLKPPSSRRLSAENANRGRHRERSQTAMVVTVAPAAYWTMIAQAPPPATATATPAAAPASAPIIGRTSTRRKSMSRIISDCCGAPMAAMKKVPERTASSGAASGSP
jgi:hypothetical protein